MAKTLRAKKINEIIYFSLGGAIIAIIIFIVLFNVFNNKKKSTNTQIGDNSNITEEASSAVGKKVDEYEEIDEQEPVQVGVNEIENNVQQENTNQIENIKEEESIDTNSQNTQEINSSNNSENANNTAMNNTNQEQDNSTDDNSQVEEETVKDPTFVMPVEGEIIKHYGKEKLIYSETLKEWTTHLGIDIKADKTTVVKASSDGVVKSIKNDPRYGLTVVLEHPNGFTSVYANLLTAEFVVIGENVKAGQTLGTVGNSATFEVLDDSHLHFEILQDGNSIDPEMYIKN